MTQKRYQYFSSTGIVWTPWFKCTESAKHIKAQLGSERRPKLRNEYRTIN